MTKVGYENRHSNGLAVAELLLPFIPDFFTSFAFQSQHILALYTIMLTETLLTAAPTPIPLTVGGHTFRMVPVRSGMFMMGDEVGNLCQGAYFCKKNYPNAAL